MKPTARSQEELFLLWNMLDIEFMTLKPTSYEQVADQLLENILWKERLRKGLEKSTTTRAASDKETLEIMRRWDSDDPQLAAIEKTLRRLASNRGHEAMVYFQRIVEDRYVQFRKQQQAIAKKPRTARHPLSVMVDQIVRANRKITENSLFHELRRVISTADNSPCTFSSNSFKPTDSKYPDVPRENLRQYLYRAKKKLSR